MNQRLPIVGVALVGFTIATYLALFQYGVVDTVWEPFFGDGSVTVLESRLSRVLPVSDAVLGAAGYLADAVTGALFGVLRWRTHPWIVVIFGVAVGPQRCLWHRGACAGPGRFGRPESIRRRVEGLDELVPAASEG